MTANTQTPLRNWIEKGGVFEPEPDRYHLYAAYSCPYAARTLITRNLKGLEDIIGVTMVGPHYGKLGWGFAGIDPFPGTDFEPFYNCDYLRDLYRLGHPDYDGRFSVPVLWDKKERRVVNNESGDIIRIFNTAFNDFLPADKAIINLCPVDRRKEIDEVEEWVYTMINDGVYRAAFATSQAEYESATNGVFKGLDKVEGILSSQEFLVGSHLTEADVRLWTTVIRFDVVYYGGGFKCNLHSIRNGYPAIHWWMRKLYWGQEAFKMPTRFDHIKITYNSGPSNPHSIIPLGPLPEVMSL